YAECVAAALGQAAGAGGAALQEGGQPPAGSAGRFTCLRGETNETAGAPAAAAGRPGPRIKSGLRMIHSPRFIAVLDACVLYPVPLRALLLSLASAGLSKPKWSAVIHDEWSRNW